MQLVLKVMDKIKIHTSGNGNLKDVIYNIYGREITENISGNKRRK